MTRGRHSTPARSPWRPLALAALGGALLLASGSGVWAALTATASSAAPQTVSAGSLSLTLAGNGAGFSSAVAQLAPGDVVHRYVTLTSGGTLGAQRLTVSATAGTANALTGTDARALRVAVTACSGSWTPTTGACTGTTTVLVPATTPLASVIAAPAVLVAGPLAAGSATALQVSLLLPDADEVTVNGTPPPNSLQGLSTNLTWTFATSQRTATTTGS